MKFYKYILISLFLVIISGCSNTSIAIVDEPLDTNIIDSNTGNIVSVQYPISTDGDSVYVKDLDLTYSDNSNFSGNVTDYFDSLTSVNYNNGTENPKILTIAFKRSIQVNRIGFGCDDASSNFSNVVVKALGSGMVVRYTNDDFINDNTKRNSFLVNLAPLAVNGFTIEFHTNDTVCLSNIIIYKATDVNARIEGLRDDGTLGTVEVSTSNRLRTVSQPYTYAIAEEEIPKSNELLKFGTRTTVAAGTSSTIWEGNTARYVYMTTAQRLNISSSSGLDTVGGTGARTLVLIGLNSTYDEITETINLSGITPVLTNKSYLRIYRAYVNESGNLYTNGGKITIYNNAGTTEQAVINIGDSQTLMTMWTVNRCSDAYLVHMSSSSNTNKGARVSLFTRQLDGGVLYPWLIKYRAYTFGGADDFNFEIPFKIPAKTDIEIRITTPTAAGTTSAGGTFELYYVDREECVE